MPVQTTERHAILTHPKGAVLEILLYGASVISWVSATKRSPELSERLFVSKSAALDGSKAVRGGIPVVFPCFGAPTHPDHMRLSQHGFARNTIWNWGGITTDDSTSVSVKLTLEPTNAIKAVYERPFRLTYIVTLFEYDLKTELHVENSSASSLFPPDVLEFQALFHNYIRAPAIGVLVGPLKFRTFYDKTEATEEGKATPKVETRSGVDVKKFTDSVYEDAGGKYEITWPGGGLDIEAKNLKDVVIWNPQADAGAKIGDMEVGGWEKFVCVEPGTVKGFVKLEPGKTWIGEQTLSVVHEERRLTSL
ncbi:galactose mutarotase-like domain-containing protein [Mucidula mucida]|nr:galactose mutarotase-like domain-containing protein [Mucidula mucida]